MHVAAAAAAAAAAATSSTAAHPAGASGAAASVNTASNFRVRLRRVRHRGAHTSFHWARHDHYTRVPPVATAAPAHRMGFAVVEQHEPRPWVRSQIGSGSGACCCG